MTRTQQQVAQAQAELDRLKTQAQEEALSMAATTWEAAAQRLAETQERLNETVRQFKKVEAQLLPWEERWLRAKAALDEHRASRPEPFERARLAPWQAQDVVLEQAFREVIKPRNQLIDEREELRWQAVRLNADLNRLTHEERNLRALARGERVDAPGPGEIRRVEDASVLRRVL